MTISVSNVALSNTFGHLFARVNELATAMSLNVVTADSNTTVGDVTVNGKVTATSFSADTFTGSGNVTFSSALFAFDNTSTLVTTGGVDIKGAIQFDSISNITILGASANTPDQNYMCVDPTTGIMKFSGVQVTSTQLKDFEVSNTPLTSASIFQYNPVSSKWGAGSLTVIDTTSIGNLAIGQVTSGLTVKGDSLLSNTTLFISSTLQRAGINTQTPRSALDVNGVIFASGDIRGFQGSDEGLKHNISTLTPETQYRKLRQLRPVQFDWRVDVSSEYVAKTDNLHDTGLIAQEVEDVFPEFIETRPDGYKAVAYNKLIPHMLAAIKYLGDKIDELERK